MECISNFKKTYKCSPAFAVPSYLDCTMIRSKKQWKSMHVVELWTTTLHLELSKNTTAKNVALNTAMLRLELQITSWLIHLNANYNKCQQKKFLVASWCGYNITSAVKQIQSRQQTFFISINSRKFIITQNAATIDTLSISTFGYPWQDSQR